MEASMQSKNWLAGSLIFGAAALASAVAFPHTVEARTVGSAVGLTNAQDTNCLLPNYGIWTNSCIRNVSLDIPLHVDSSSGTAKQVYVPVYAQSPQAPVGCRSESISKNIGVTYIPAGGAFRYATVFQTDTQIDLLGNLVPSGGALLVNCQVGQNGWVKVIGWENRNGTGWP
jgi:hypothetical protein